MKKVDFKIDDLIIIQKTCDYDQIYKVLIEIISSYSPPLKSNIKNLTEYAHKLAYNAEVYIAKENLILGLIAVYSNDSINKIGYITQIAVKSEAQSRGIGKRLMNISYLICKEKGMLKIKLEVRKNNIKAIRFYKNEGFEDCGNATNDSIYMEKTL